MCCCCWVYIFESSYSYLIEAVTLAQDHWLTNAPERPAYARIKGTLWSSNRKAVPGHDIPRNRAPL